MQRIKFTTVTGDEIEFTDDNTQVLNGKWVPFFLLAIDPNSQGMDVQASSCVGMDGQHVVAAYRTSKSIQLVLAFDGRGACGPLQNGSQNYNGGDVTMYYFRRLILKHFPLGTTGTLEYQNNNGTYKIDCTCREYPAIERKVGNLCYITLYLVADYPYWRKEVVGNTYTASVGDPISVVVKCEGDVASPLIADIGCTTAIAGVTDNKYMVLKQTEGGTGKMVVCKPLEVGQHLKINTGVNNQVWCKLIDVDGTETIANNYIDYRNSDLLRNNVGSTKLQLNVYGTAGAVTVQYKYNNLFVAV